MWVGLGGGLGSLLRSWVGRMVGERYRGHFPLGTFLINISGSFVIGYLSVLFMVDWRDRYGSALNSLWLTGLLRDTRPLAACSSTRPRSPETEAASEPRPISCCPP